MYRDIYLYIAQYLTPYETKQLAMTCKTASGLRQLKCRKRLEYNVECRPYYPEQYIKEIYKQETEKYIDEDINEKIFFRGKEVGCIIHHPGFDGWYLCYTLTLNKPRDIVKMFLKEVGLRLFTDDPDDMILCSYSPQSKYYDLKELAIYDFLTFCKHISES